MTYDPKNPQTIFRALHERIKESDEGEGEYVAFMLRSGNAYHLEYSSASKGTIDLTQDGTWKSSDGKTKLKIVGLSTLKDVYSKMTISKAKSVKKTLGGALVEEESERMQFGDEQSEQSDNAGKGTLHQLVRLAQLYMSVCTALGLTRDERQCPQNEYNIMRTFHQVRRNGREKDGLSLSTSIFSIRGSNATTKKVTIERTQARDIFQTWLRSEAEHSGPENAEKERARRRAVNRSLGIYEMFLSLYQNCFYSISRRVSRHMIRVCTPICSGITGVGSLVGSISRYLDAGVLIDGICNLATSKMLDQKHRTPALRARMTGLKNSAITSEQRTLLNSWINRLSTTELKPDSELAKKLLNEMKFLAVSFVGTGTRKDPCFFPSSCLILALTEDNTKLESLSGVKFFEAFNKALPRLWFCGENQKAAEGACQSFCMSVFNLIYEDMNLVSKIFGKDFRTRKELYNSGMKKPRPTSDNNVAINGSGFSAKYTYKLASGQSFQDGKGQLFNNPSIKVERQMQDNVDELLEQINSVLFNVESSGSTATVSLTELIATSIELLEKRNTEKIYAGAKLGDLTGNDVDVTIGKGVNPFYWGNSTASDEEPSDQAGPSKRRFQGIGGLNKRFRAF